MSRRPTSSAVIVAVALLGTSFILPAQDQQ